VSTHSVKLASQMVKTRTVAWSLSLQRLHIRLRQARRVGVSSTNKLEASRISIFKQEPCISWLLKYKHAALENTEKKSKPRLI